MFSSVTYLRRSLHLLSPAASREVSVSSWYDTNLRTWQATSTDFPYFVNARRRSVPEVSHTRREAVGRLLANLITSLQD
jgi:hypothetical protein